MLFKLGDTAVGVATARALGHIAVPNPVFSTNAPDPGSSYASYRVYNIENHQPVESMISIRAIESALGLEAKKSFLPMQNGDVVVAHADVGALKQDLGFEPKAPLAESVVNWVAWYRYRTVR